MNHIAGTAAVKTVDAGIGAVVHSFRYSIGYLRELLSDVAETDMAVQPAGVSNHPAWTIGHLEFVCQMIGGVIGIAPSISEEQIEKYGPGSTPTSDSDGYGSKVETMDRLERAGRRLCERVGELSEVELDATFPDEAYQDVFPTVRHALTQVLVGHTAFHVGQIAVWRRAMGLASIGRSYE